MFKEFKEFAMRGNVVDLAVGIIIGAAFSRIVTSLVNDVVMPPIGMLTGKVDFSDLKVVLQRAAGEQSPEVAIYYGRFINSIIDFLIVALAVYFLVRQMNRLMSTKEPAEAKPTTKDCPYCLATIPRAATRCPQCTSQLEAV